MATRRRILCEIDVDEDVQTDILDCDDKACAEIGAFLEELQGDPLPERRKRDDRGFFYVQLPCRYFVSWELLGDVVKLVTTGDCKGVLVRILGVGRKLQVRR